MRAKWSLAGLIGAGTVAALCAAVLVASLGGGPRRAAGSAEAEVEIAVATEDLRAGRVIEQDQVVVETLSGEIPEGHLPAALVIGRVLTVPMVEGQTFTTECFAQEGTGLRLASALPEGMRAVSVSLSNHSGLNGLLYPGSVVDVLAAFRDPSQGSGRGEMISGVLLQGVQVLAINSQTVLSEDDGATKSVYDRSLTVTLMLDSTQAEAIQLAMEHGSISLALRNPIDAETVQAGPMALGELFRQGDDAEPVLAIPPKQGPTQLMFAESVMEEAVDPDPPPAAPAVRAAAEEPDPLWQMVVIRGKTVNRIDLPVPKDGLEMPELRAEPLAGDRPVSNPSEAKEGLDQDDGSNWEADSRGTADVFGDGADSRDANAESD